MNLTAQPMRTKTPAVITYSPILPDFPRLTQLPCVMLWQRLIHILQTVSYNNYTATLSEAKTVLNNPTAEQSEVNAAATKLNNAINALQAKLDMTKLYAARDKANALNSSDYVDFSEVASLVNMIPETAFNSQQEVDDYADS